ncbi:MAG: phosphatase PAP2 family protein [Acidobacteriota bacterium]
MKPALLLASFLLFCNATMAQAGEPTSPDAGTSSSEAQRTNLFRTILRDEAHMWTNPFRHGSYSSHTFSKYVLPFTLITGGLIASDHRTSNLLPNTSDQARWSLRVSQVGAPYTIAGIAAAYLLVGKLGGHPKAEETGILGLEAVAHSQLITLGLKYITRRERPFDFHAKGGGGTAFWKGGDSFPSGHASGSFALATVLAYEYGRDHHWIPYVTYGLATLVAASRFSGEKHWLSDLFVGSTTGFLIGRYVYKHHHDPGVETGIRARLKKVTPEFNLGLRGFSAQWNLGRHA